MSTSQIIWDWFNSSVKWDFILNCAVTHVHHFGSFCNTDKIDAKCNLHITPKQKLYFTPNHKLCFAHHTFISIRSPVFNNTIKTSQFTWKKFSLKIPDEILEICEKFGPSHSQKYDKIASVNIYVVLLLNLGKEM